MAASLPAKVETKPGRDAVLNLLKKQGWEPFENNLAESVAGPIDCFERLAHDGFTYRANVGPTWATVYRRGRMEIIDMMSYKFDDPKLVERIKSHK